MYVTRYNPARDLQDFRRSFHDFNSFLDSFISKREAVNLTDFEPSVNTREGEFAYHVELDLPGMKKEDISVDVKDNMVTISGERKVQKEIDEEDYYRIESRYGKFSRSFSLPEDVDVENIHAESQDGVLEVVIPKLEKKENKPRKIEIQ